MVGTLVILSIAIGFMVGFIKVLNNPLLNGTIINGNTIRRSI